MPSLYDKLKHIYTSGDALTVLQLLKEFIDATKNVEVAETPLYEHNVTLIGEKGRAVIRLYTKSEEAFNYDTLHNYVGQRNGIMATGKASIEDVVYSVYQLGIDSLTGYFSYYTVGAVVTRISETSNEVSVNDTVKSLQGD